MAKRQLSWEEQVIAMLKRRDRELERQATREQTREACKRYGEQIAAMYPLPAITRPPE